MKNLHILRAICIMEYLKCNNSFLDDSYSLSVTPHRQIFSLLICAGTILRNIYERHPRDERRYTLGLTNFIRGDLISRRQDALRRGHPSRSSL